MLWYSFFGEIIVFADLEYYVKVDLMNIFVLDSSAYLFLDKGSHCFTCDGKPEEACNEMTHCPLKSENKCLVSNILQWISSQYIMIISMVTFISSCWLSVLSLSIVSFNDHTYEISVLMSVATSVYITYAAV